MLGYRPNRERTFPQVRRKRCAVPRVTLERKLAFLKKKNEPALDVWGSTDNRGLAAHNPRLAAKRGSPSESSRPQCARTKRK
jgi:hypothetical protein